MGKHILQSHNQFAFTIPERVIDGKHYVAVELPKSRYRESEQYIQGPRKGFHARPIIELNDEEMASIEASPQIMGLIAKGVYRWLDHVPESQKTAEDLVAELRAENETLKKAQALPTTPVVNEEMTALQKKLAALEVENEALKAPKDDPEKIDLAARIAALEEENAGLRDKAVTAVAITEHPEIDTVRGELLAKPIEELRTIAEKYGVETSGEESESDLVDAILVSSGYTPEEDKASEGPVGSEETEA
jgi:hypothetical protein